MAEERYEYNMAAAIDTLLEETTALYAVNKERVSSLRALARESRAMRAAAQEYAASSMSSSESSTLGLSASESSESLDKGSEMGSSFGDLDETDVTGIWHTTRACKLSLRNSRRDEAYKRTVEHLVMRLRNWRMELEEAKYMSIDFDSSLTVWTRKERNAMRAEIRMMSYEIRKKKVIERMVELNQRRVTKGLTEETKLAVEMIELLLQDIFLLRIMPFKDVVFPLSMENIYDWDRVSNAINCTHTPAECQEFWYTKFHPDVNRKAWSKAENKALAALADVYNLHHWNEIAAQLNTNRSGLQCFVQFRRYLYKDRPLVFKQAQKKTKEARAQDQG